jgi:pimeloyl-ACP methyl ester carboxylesterase
LGASLLIRWWWRSEAKRKFVVAPLPEVGPKAQGRKRMVNFKDIPDDKIKSIKASTLIIIADKDVITPEHAIEMHRQIANSELATIPGGHGEYIGELQQ